MAIRPLVVRATVGAAQASNSCARRQTRGPGKVVIGVRLELIGVDALLLVTARRSSRASRFTTETVYAIRDLLAHQANQRTWPAGSADPEGHLRRRLLLCVVYSPAIDR